MKLLKNYFLIKVDKIQIKLINDKYSIRLSKSFGKNYAHYFFYLSESIFPRIENIINKIDSIKVYIASCAEIEQSKGKLFKYNVSELYLDNGKIISL